MTSPRLVCLGNLTIDDVVLPDGVVRRECVGGDALYAALAARLVEPSVEMVAPIGSDFPAAVMARIVAAGFGTEGLKPRALPTLRNRAVYDAEGGRHWECFFTEADFDALSPDVEDLPQDCSEAAGLLVLAMTLTAQERLVAWARRDSRATLALDPQEDYIAGNVARLRSLIGRTDVFLPSAEEVRRMLGHEDWLAAARLFAALGPAIVVIKLGRDGSLAYLRHGDAVLCCTPPSGLDVVDATGAGDSFCGAFMARLLQAPAAIEDALRIATAAASIAITDFGVEPLFSATPAAAASLARAVEVVRVSS